MDRYAILISCEDYKNFNNIDFCHADAFLIEETLRDYCDYKKENIVNITLYSSCEYTPDKILSEIKEKINGSEDGSTILFYFAGHGMLHNDEAYLVLPDTCNDDLPNTALSLKKVNKCLSENNKANFRIFDACHSGFDARGIDNNNSFTDVVLKQAKQGWITLASCSKNEESYPDNNLEQGIFTYCFTESIKEFKESESIFVEALKIKVCDKMDEWCKKNNKKQTPTMNAAVSGNMEIAKRICNLHKDNTNEENHKCTEEIVVTFDSKNILPTCNDETIKTTSYQNSLWESPTGIKLPKKADFLTLLTFNSQLHQKDLRQIKVAYEAEAYEMLASFIWSTSMNLLRKKVLSLGGEFVADMVGIDNQQYIQNLPIFETINLAFELGFINDLGKIRLKNNNELIQHYLNTKNSEEMTEEQIKEIVRACIQYILGQEHDNLNLEYNEFRENLKLELIEKDIEQLDRILNSPYFYRKTTIRTLINLFKETKETENSNVAANMITIIPYIWDSILSEDRYLIGLTYAKYVNENNKGKIVLKNVLMKVNGFDYVPENLKSLTFIEAAKKLISAHFSMDNFHTEPKFAKELSSLGKRIPKPALEVVINAALLIKIGNRFGISWSAQEYIDKILQCIHSEQWKVYFNHYFKSSEEILYKISNNNNMLDRWCSIANTYSFDELDINDSKIKKLLTCSKKYEKESIRSIGLNLYNSL